MSAPRVRCGIAAVKTSSPAGPTWARCERGLAQRSWTAPPAAPRGPGTAPPTDYGHTQNALLGAVLTGGPAGCDYAQIGGYFSLSRTRLITEFYIASGAPSSDLPAQAGWVSTWSGTWLNCSGRARNPLCSPGN